MTDGQSASLSWCQAPIWNIFSVWRLWVSWCGAPFLTRGWACNLLVQLLLGLAWAVTFVSKSCRTHDHILRSHLRPPNCLTSCCIAMIASTKPLPSLLMHYHGNGSQYVCVCVCVCKTGGLRLIWQCPLHYNLHDLYYAFQIWVCSAILKKWHTEGNWQTRIENLLSCDMILFRHSTNHNFM
jgi:hypothetical protein